MNRTLHMRASCLILPLVITISSLAFAGVEQTKPADIQASLQSTTGQAINIPTGDKITVLLFYRPGQQQSDEALKQLADILGKRPVQPLLVISGPPANKQPASTYPMIQDADYSLSGKMQVHAWPTTVIVSPKGDVVAHVAGTGPGYALEASTYLAFIAGEINHDTMEQRLASPDEVKDSPAQAAGRHLQVAKKFMARDSFEAALMELDRGLKLDPTSTPLKATKIRVLLALDKADDAKALLPQLDASALPAPQLALVQGMVAAANGDLDNAQRLLLNATKLNPEPAEAWYQLGKVYEQRGDMPKAAAAYKAAYEHK